MAEQNRDGAPDLDLFGQPIQPIRDRRGRPSFQKTKENQEFVSVRAAAGWSQKRIARDMGIDEKTLRKNFSRELEHGPTLVEGVVLDVLMRRVREGHVPSIRQLMERVDAAAPAAPRKPVEDGDEEKAEKLGKKEERLLAAQEVPDDYGDIFAKRRQARTH